MKNIMKVGLASIILAAGVAQTHAAAATGTNWDQNVTFQLTQQSATGKKTIATKDIIADLSGTSITIIRVAPVTTSVTVTNPPELALGAGQTNYATAGSLTNTVTLTFSNSVTTNVQIIATQTSATNAPTYTFPNNAITISNETHNTFASATNLPTGLLTAVLVSTNGTTNGVFTVTGTSTNLVSTNITVPALDSKKNKLVVRQTSPSGTSTNEDKWIVRSAGGSKATDLADVTPFFEQNTRTVVSTAKGQGTTEISDFDFAYKGPLRFDTRGNGTRSIAPVKGASQRKNFNSTIVGSQTTTNGTGGAYTISGKYNLTGGTLE
jgi:hypothetical protein